MARIPLPGRHSAVPQKCSASRRTYCDSEVRLIVAGRRILVVDDEAQITRVLRTTLSSHGYEIRVANDAIAALDVVNDWPPELIITDLSMPEMSGVDLTRKVRAKSEVPIIVLSVRGEERSKVEALDAGADDYVTKPFNMNELLA